jgi:hypothetical protein
MLFGGRTVLLNPQSLPIIRGAGEAITSISPGDIDMPAYVDPDGFIASQASRRDNTSKLTATAVTFYFSRRHGGQSGSSMWTRKARLHMYSP